MTLISIWLALTLFAGFYWARRHRAFWTGVVWSLLLSPFASFVIGVYAEPKVGLDARALHLRTPTCEGCLKVLPHTAACCSACGTYVVPS